jgi:hypothetical protein
MSDQEIDRRTMAFIKACPHRTATLARCGALYFRAVRWVAVEGLA